MSQLVLSLAQLAVAVILSAAATFLAFFLFQSLTRGLDEWEALRKGNAALGVVLGAIVVSVAIVLRPALSLDTSGWDVGSQLFVTGLLAQALQLAVGLALAVAAVALSLFAFAALTRGIDEIAELQKGNLAVGALLAGVVLGFSVLISQAMGDLLRAITNLVF